MLAIARTAHSTYCAPLPFGPAGALFFTTDEAGGVG